MDLHFDIADLLEEDTESKRSFDDEESSSLHPSKKRSEPASGHSIYRPVRDYEAHHRYDPRLRWSPSAERNVVRKVCDLRCFAISSSTNTLLDRSAHLPVRVHFVPCIVC